MGLFDFFKSKSETDLPEIPEDVFIEKGDEIARGGHSSRIEASLDGVYEFLKADFETRGYNDSLINSDSSYRDENVEVLMWDLIILCKHAISKYDDKIVNLDNHISSRKRLGALDVIYELESEKKRINEKIKEIEEKLKELSNQINESIINQINEMKEKHKEDMKNLIEYVSENVLKKTGIKLETEIKILE